MSVFDLDTAGTSRADAAENVVTPDEFRPGFFHKVLPGIGTLYMKGEAEVGRFIGMSGGALLEMGASATPVESDLSPLATKPQERELATEQTLDGYYRKMDRYLTTAVDFWTPRANEIGTAGRVLGGLAEAAPALMLGGGNPAPLVASQEMNTAVDLAREGVSAPAAIGVGAVQGAATAIGFRMPFLGKGISDRVISGALGNLAVGAGTALASRELLKSAGEEEAARQFNPLDVEGRALDLLTGAAFGGIAHVQLRSAEKAAILTAANGRHFQEDTAPGVPVDLDASIAHQKAIEQATNQLLSGEPVVAPARVTEVEFSPHEFVEQSLRERAAAVKDFQPEEETATNPIPVAESLSPAERVVEGRFREQIGGNIDAAMEAYAKLEDSQGGKVLNTDTARELSADYLKDRTLSAAVHEPASYLVKELYARKLAEAPGPGEEPRVLFSAGGTGAGKTTGLRTLPDLVASAQIVYDTNMNTLTSAIRKIDQALEAGKKATVVYTYREPIDALTKGALPRAMRQEKKFGSGRTVPVNEHIGTHVGSRKVVEQLAAHYAGDKRVEILAIDNSRGKAGVRVGAKGVEMASGGAKVVALREIPKFGEGAYNSLRERALKELEAARSSGAISEAVHRGFAGEDVARGMVEPGRPGDRGQSQPADSSRGVDDPLTASVREHLQESDTQIPTGAVDADGNPVTRSARELMAEADAGIAEAEQMGKGIMAAVTCAIQRGPDAA
jgi:hypothetical protein